MSDPVTNVEIEDVLSSIRRLISENDRSPKPQAARPERESVLSRHTDETESAEAAQERLVLTPSLRVAEVAPQEDRHEAETALDTPHAHAWEDVSEPETGLADAPEMSAADAVVAEISEELAEAGFDPVDGVSLERAREIDARIVHWEKNTESTSAQEPAYEPDEPGDSDYAGTDVEPLEWQDEQVDTEAEEAPFVAVTPDDEPEVAEVEAFEPKPAPQTEFEEEMSAEEALAGLAGRIEAELRDEIPGHIEAELVQDDGLDALVDDDAVVLDEAMLRDMVADIVRQELQGALGERITRNVRKLVRREIHRALAAHELD